MTEFNTPMMQQYLRLKAAYTDCLLFFRLGDFYELFLEDAKIGNKVLGITLTSRSRGKDGRIPMAGVPYHSVDSYLARLVKAGYKVAICEQMNEADGRNLVEREVVRVVTPGTLLDEKNLDQRQNNYTLSFYLKKNILGIAVADFSTGNFQQTEKKIKHNLKQVISNYLIQVNPSECVLPSYLYDDYQFLNILNENKNLNIFKLNDDFSCSKEAAKFIKKYFKIRTLKAFNLNNNDAALIASANLLNYLQSTQKEKISHIENIQQATDQNFLLLDKASIINLELVNCLNSDKKKGSLIYHLDQTATAMGGRKLRRSLLKPLRKQKQIQARLDSVEELLKKAELREQLNKTITEIDDIERILAKISIKTVNPRELISLAQSINQSLKAKNLLKKCQQPLLRAIEKNINQNLKRLSLLIQQTIIEEAPLDPKKGNLIKTGLNKELDKLKKVLANNQKWLLDFENKEKEKTKISSLKVKFNKVFGFYIEISKANLNKAPKHYDRKQTLVNAERFITPELKKHEEIILLAEEKTQNIEYQIFLDLIEKILKKVSQVKKAAEQIALLDYLLNFANLAEKHQYCKPKLNNNGKLIIREGRHPVVESLEKEKQFIPNDSYLNQKENQLLLITGPNMAGKSVYIRQVALIALMAHLGSYVPATKANICLLDKIFVRSGASDMISAGLSTFMLEMVEAAYILNHATNDSLIIMDEIGRGTSTYDGISIAWSIAQYLVSKKSKQAKTLFATHYHELQELATKFPKKIKNFHLKIAEYNNEPIFLHQVTPGGASHSFGIAVAKLAGIPEEVSSNAKQILQKMEAKQSFKAKLKQSKAKLRVKTQKKSELIDLIKSINIEQMTPLKALNTLAEIINKTENNAEN
ncbi:MAG: DNA mismatch repair protein MutS [Candidatus Woesebacteria bacterium]|jgi:DNA mismatch repair protein MutS